VLHNFVWNKIGQPLAARRVKTMDGPHPKVPRPHSRTPSGFIRHSFANAQVVHREQIYNPASQ